MGYTPTTFRGESVEDLAFWLESELTTIARELSETTVLELRPLHAEPPKPRAGMIVYADGTDWNPGSGEGVYSYSLAGTWVKL